jgi:hypothetical protein
MLRKIENHSLVYFFLGFIFFSGDVVSDLFFPSILTLAVSFRSVAIGIYVWGEGYGCLLQHRLRVG